MMIDAHCHITAEEFDLDRDQVLAEAVKVGVKAIVAVCEFPGDFQNVLDLSKRYPDLIFPCIGVHPVQVGSRSVTEEECNKAELWIKKHSEGLAGIGEVGLDFTPYHIKSPEDKEVQREVFRRQIRLSKELNLPFWYDYLNEHYHYKGVFMFFDALQQQQCLFYEEGIVFMQTVISQLSHDCKVHLLAEHFGGTRRNVHSRSAGRPVIETLVQEGAQNVLLHAFDGKPSVALKGVDAGYFFSVPPSIIRSEQKQRLVKQIPLSNLLLETDAPALGPEKQERNEPKNIEISCKEISRIKNIPVSQIITETTKNALRLFTKLPR